MEPGGGAPPPDLPALVARTEGLQPWRRILHAATGVLIVAVPTALGWVRETTALVLGALLLVLLAADALRLVVPRVNALFFRFFPSLASPREASRVASSTWYVAGALLVVALFPWRLAAAAMLVLAFADPAASVVGRLGGRRRVGKGSLEGSLAFLAVAVAVLGPTVGWLPGIIAALAVTAVEVAPVGLDDNLVVPFSAAAVLWLLGV